MIHLDDHIKITSITIAIYSNNRKRQTSSQVLTWSVSLSIRPLGVTSAWPIIGKVIHKIGST